MAPRGPCRNFLVSVLGPETLDPRNRRTLMGYAQALWEGAFRSRRRNRRFPHNCDDIFGESSSHWRLCLNCLNLLAPTHGADSTGSQHAESSARADGRAAGVNAVENSAPTPRIPLTGATVFL